MDERDGTSALQSVASPETVSLPPLTEREQPERDEQQWEEDDMPARENEDDHGNREA
jgi:hypothetical protein